MSDPQLTIAAASIEVGLAAVVLLAVLLGKPARHRTVVVLGALTPAILVMPMLAYMQFVHPAPGSMVGAGWIMGFGAYAAAFVAGALVSLIPRPENLYGRYFLGVAVTPLSIGLLILV